MWVGGDGSHVDSALWQKAWTLEDQHTPDISQLSRSGRQYWQARQDGHYLDWDGILAASDGSAKGAMGAGAVLRDATGSTTTHVCKVGGHASSFRAEAAAMHQAIIHAPPELPLAILTDSMNVVQALQAWDHAEYMRDMSWQRNANIIVQILLAINGRSSSVTVVKVKSHRGVQLNEQADVAAGYAADAPDGEGMEDSVDTLYVPEPPDSAVQYQWVPAGSDEMHTTADHRQVIKRWEQTDHTLTVAQEQRKDTFACQLMTRAGWGQELWQTSKLCRLWTELEERRWMQMVGRVFPVNTYLRRIDKHPTGECSWCKNGKLETLAHFQSECPQFALNLTAAHHAIARAVMAYLKDLSLPNWTFYYETELQDLPFQFKWSSRAEEEEQAARRPDGVAWNPILGKVIFLEFTRAMDNPQNMVEALAAKGQQYCAAMLAVNRANPLISASTAPMIFGVRGTVMVSEAREGLAPLQLKRAQLEKALAHGVRAAITAASEMCSARFAALKSLPALPRGPDGKRVKVVIPPKPFRSQWRGDRGGGSQTR